MRLSFHLSQCSTTRELGQLSMSPRTSLTSPARSCAVLQNPRAYQDRRPAFSTSPLLLVQVRPILVRLFKLRGTVLQKPPRNRKYGRARNTTAACLPRSTDV